MISIRRSPTAAMLAMIAAILPSSRAQDEPAPAPPADGHFRVASVEIGGTESVRALEAVIEVPNGMGVLVMTDTPGGVGPRVGSRSSDGSVIDYRLVAILNRFGSVGGSSPDGTAALYLTNKRANGGGLGGGAGPMPLDGPLDELLTTDLEPGRYPIGEPVEAFTRAGEVHSILVGDRELLDERMRPAVEVDPKIFK